MTNLTRVPSIIDGDISRMWSSFFGDQPLPFVDRSSNSGLSYQIRADGDDVIAEVEVPGVDPTEVKVRCEGRAIIVESPRGSTYFSIGSRVDIENVTASIRHGLLTLRVPKRESRSVVVKVVDKEE